MNPRGDWQAAWDSYRRRRWQYGAAAGALVLGFLGIALVGPARLAGHSGAVAPFFWVFLIGTVGTTWRLRSFRCPRCGERFTVRSFRRRLLTSKCMHCGIRVGEDPSKAQGAT